ncbi:prolipoprotein diacylglyceryl transferase [Cereibacter sphaeroides]|jgi:phosphatidylglycerol:prolipoprotein diacylglycerol transferase|uniref:Phosphatidylglycerol--prolipoprotein diacylglyceryl transferase n=3 Tax=Cereibacter sphaeroides TaxID=1063 RepID=LGT_CERS1|nr:prolipoprotein diacylglyceryl transferase [Cereibacter sphaeroides]A3PG85.1 RecName: Full=Phosphatidylglycerol--prolipoprotein diacylglyceryl transferase [Cereibacter sphaeroides ATCC 17029]ABN75351.1 prolipoprotein diacylglyceryl transferase [Cereibacter sphaeroides ATCC 17029]AZB63173.1 prolipoprotein diacylglyceryl transferase [Cereibacter sphaeroides]AZB67025.1 prolipoprotein diacylglyceryl transferase [Cereibacter sphaeroides]RHZ91341.1 prolipoprotein diacylglyceryl transferase [Cereib
MSYIPFPDISPELFSIELFGVTFALRWYALAYIAGLLIGWRLVLRMIRAERLWSFGPPMTEDQLERLLTWVILGVILGGRLGFVLFYQPAHYLAHPLDILKVWEGGMSFHGGFLGVMTALVAFCLKERISILPVADLLAAATPPGLFLGRIANFINAELWGRPTTLPWGVAFPGEAAQSCPGIEGICARHPSQIYEAGLEGILLFAVLSLLVWRRGWLHWPGSVSGMFLAGYGATRFLVEFVRQPDAQFVSAGNPLGLAWQISGYGLTMGQILSLPMILLGLYLILRSRRTA